MLTFTAARADLLDKLATVPGFLTIQQVQDIEIEGLHIENSDIIEEQIEEQSEGDYALSEEAISIGKIKDDLQGLIGDSNCNVRIVFKVGPADKSTDEQDPDAQPSDSRSSQSASRSSSSESGEL